jgi:hypothetical protein
VGVPPKRDMMDFANPTFEQMARHWFDSFCTNPSAESFAHSRSRFFFCRWEVLTVYFCTPNMFIRLWFGFVYGTNPPLGTLII